MEAFSLLKYWRGAGGASLRTTIPTAIVTSAAPQPEKQEEEEDCDDGSFFDLEFAAPDDGGNDEGDDYYGEDDGSVGTEEERDFDFDISSADIDGERADPNQAISPSDDLFFKGNPVALDSSSSEANSLPSPPPPLVPLPLRKPATRFRVFLLGLKKPKPSAEEGTPAGAAPKQQSRLFTVKFKIEEVPIISLFTRDSSSRVLNSKSQLDPPPLPQQQHEEEDSVMASADAKRLAKVAMRKYLKMMKPLYGKVSKRYGQKLKFSGQLSLGSGKATTAATTVPETVAAEGGDGTDPESNPTPSAPPENPKQTKQQGSHLPTGLRVVCKHLGKSRSASAAIAAVPSQRRDDSLRQQQDGIQSAIAHCKRSFHASADPSEEISLARSSSDPCTVKSVDG